MQTVSSQYYVGKRIQRRLGLLSNTRVHAWNYKGTPPSSPKIMRRIQLACDSVTCENVTCDSSATTRQGGGFNSPQPQGFISPNTSVSLGRAHGDCTTVRARSSGTNAKLPDQSHESSDSESEENTAAEGPLDDSSSEPSPEQNDQFDCLSYTIHPTGGSPRAVVSRLQVW